MSDSLPFVFPISVLSFCGRSINVAFAFEMTNFHICTIHMGHISHLKDVHKTPTELWVEVQVEQVSLVLLLLQDLTILHF